MHSAPKTVRTVTRLCVASRRTMTTMLAITNKADTSGDRPLT